MRAAWAAWIGLRPVRSLAAQAARITPESLSLRLPRNCVDAELNGLSNSFNLALERLEQAYARLEAFNADVAHELRTPLATLIGGIEVTLAAERPREELEHLLASNLDLLRRLAAIVGDMLFLARADSGEKAAERAEVSLADEARKVLDYYEGLIHERGAEVAIEGDARLRCNPGLVRRALSNLLSNALKHSNGNAPIAIVVEQDGHAARVGVRNCGATIAPEALPRLFDRFYRGDPARAAGADSHGLGLAIVRAVALMHGGSVDARSAQGLTEVGFSLALA
jgi:two-component system heavy metal sensor histidine kinase CusS